MPARLSTGRHWSSHGRHSHCQRKKSRQKENGGTNKGRTAQRCAARHASMNSTVQYCCSVQTALTGQVSMRPRRVPVCAARFAAEGVGAAVDVGRRGHPHPRTPHMPPPHLQLGDANPGTWQAPILDGRGREVARRAPRAASDTHRGSGRSRAGCGTGEGGRGMLYTDTDWWLGSTDGPVLCHFSTVSVQVLVGPSPSLEQNLGREKGTKLGGRGSGRPFRCSVSTAGVTALPLPLREAPLRTSPLAP